MDGRKVSWLWYWWIFSKKPNVYVEHLSSSFNLKNALKELGVDVVLLNSNPATIMTDPEMAYRTYIEPITKDTIKMIIEKENVDAVLSTMGGQTALNMCVELEEEEYLSKNGVALLGARVDTIKKTEDRKLSRLN